MALEAFRKRASEVAEGNAILRHISQEKILVENLNNNDGPDNNTNNNTNDNDNSSNNNNNNSTDNNSSNNNNSNINPETAELEQTNGGTMPLISSFKQKAKEIADRNAILRHISQDNMPVQNGTTPQKISPEEKIKMAPTFKMKAKELAEGAARMANGKNGHKTEESEESNAQITRSGSGSGKITRTGRISLSSFKKTAKGIADAKARKMDADAPPVDAEETGEQENASEQEDNTSEQEDNTTEQEDNTSATEEDNHLEDEEGEDELPPPPTETDLQSGALFRKKAMEVVMVRQLSNEMMKLTVKSNDQDEIHQQMPEEIPEHPVHEDDVNNDNGDDAEAEEEDVGIPGLLSEIWNRADKDTEVVPVDDSVLMDPDEMLRDRSTEEQQSDEPETGTEAGETVEKIMPTGAGIMGAAAFMSKAMRRVKIKDEIRDGQPEVESSENDVQEGAETVVEDNSPADIANSSTIEGEEKADSITDGITDKDHKLENGVSASEPVQTETADGEIQTTTATTGSIKSEGSPLIVDDNTEKDKSGCCANCVIL